MVLEIEPDRLEVKRRDVSHLNETKIGQWSKGVAPSVSHPPVLLYNHLALPRSLTWLSNIPSFARQPDNRSPIRPCSSQTRGWLRFLEDESLPPSALGLIPQSKWAEMHAAHTVVNPSVLLRQWWLWENPKQNSSAFTGPTPTPTLIPKEVRWPDVVYLPVTTAAMKPLHTSMLKLSDRDTSLCVCTHWKTEKPFLHETHPRKAISEAVLR